MSEPVDTSSVHIMTSFGLRLLRREKHYLVLHKREGHIIRWQGLAYRTYKALGKKPEVQLIRLKLSEDELTLLRQRTPHSILTIYDGKEVKRKSR